MSARHSVPFLLLIFGLFSAAVADVFTCGQEQIALDPDNVAEFRLDSKIMGPDQHCSWNFTFPDGYMADVTVDGELMHYMDIFELYSKWDDNNFQLLTYQGNDKTPSSNMARVMWPPSGFLLQVNTIVGTTMVLTVDIQLVPLSVEAAMQSQLTTAKNAQPFLVQFKGWLGNSSAVVTSTTGVSLSYAAPSLTDWHFLTNYYVYEHADDGSLVFRGTLYGSFINNQKQEIRSNGKALTVYKAPYNQVVEGTLIINDLSNVASSIVQATWSPYDQADLQYSQAYLVEADKMGNKGVLTIVNQASGANAIYLTKIDLDDGSSPVKLLAGGMIADYDTQGTLLGSFGDGTQGLPIYLPGDVRTFVVEKGSAVIYYTTAMSNTQYTEAINGRTGMIMTDHYDFNWPDQDSADFVLKSMNADPFTFSYSITAKDANEDAYINVTLWGETGKGKDEESNYIVDLHTTTPGTYNYTAMELLLTIVGGNGVTKGTMLPYKIYSTATAPETQSTTVPKTVPSSSSSPGPSSPPATVESSTTVQLADSTSPLLSTLLSSSTMSSSGPTGAGKTGGPTTPSGVETTTSPAAAGGFGYGMIFLTFTAILLL